MNVPRPTDDTSAASVAGNPVMSPRTAAIALILLACAYACLVVPSWSEGYIDFGDGNYMYISWRVAEGAVLYRDILAPQPPMHFWIGEAAYRLGQAAFSHPVYGFRLVSLLIRLGTMVLVYAATLRILGGSSGRLRALNRPAGVLAALVYLMLPLGFWWSAGYQSEPAELLFMVAAFVVMMPWTAPASAMAGLLMAAAVLTNMTAVPYALFFILGLALRRPRLLLPYCAGLVVPVAGVWTFMELRTGAFLENVVFNQVGSFPRKEFLPVGETFWTYALGKLIREGGDVLALEGGYIALGLLGLLGFTRRGPDETREYASLFAAAAVMSILYVSKGGTVDYIFTIGEPWVAMFAGAFLFHFWRKNLRGASWIPTVRDLTPLARCLAALFLFLAIAGPGLLHAWGTLKQRTYELDEFGTAQVVREIQRHSGPEDLVVAPPHYAFIARRRIALDYSELLLWTLKYLNETQDRIPGRGVQTTEQLAALLRERKIAFVALDLNQTGKLDVITAAISQSYEPLRSEPLRTLNTSLQFYTPNP